MNLFKRVQKLLGGEKAVPATKPLPPRVPIQDDEPEIVVPEISVAELQAALAEPDASSTAPLVIDIREPYEWRLVRLPMVRHIPMNDIPAHLDTIPRDRPVVIMCAHGSRSASVAAWLIEQGVDASSLAGGITQWARAGGAVEQGGEQG